MHVKRVTIKAFKRFTNLTIDGIPDTAKLVVLIGPNGCGKSCVFEAFRMWQAVTHFGGHHDDPTYYHKHGLPQQDYRQSLQIEFHEPLPTPTAARRRLFYIRSAYRNEPDFALKALQHQGPDVAAPTRQRIIDNEAFVSWNYQRLVSATIAQLYNGSADTIPVAELRTRLIGQVRDSMHRLFPGTVLTGIGSPLEDGSFYFRKGASDGFRYKNLSAAEKAAFDLFLDLILRHDDYPHAVYAIDEPDAHLHPEAQERVLREIVDIVPHDAQLWITTHAIGVLRAARDMNRAQPCSVAFLDLTDRDFDQGATISPQIIDRDFWQKLHHMALHDLAGLVAPETIVLCEGTCSPGSDSGFDAACYRTIFATEFPDADFLSVGSASDVEGDRLGAGRTIQAIAPRTKLIRVIDRDDRSEREIDAAQRGGVRVLSRRHIEAYLLDDEIILALCAQQGQEDLSEQALTLKQDAVASSIARTHPQDDVKSAAGHIYTGLKRVLGLTGRGNTASAFMQDTMAPLVKPGTTAYAELKRDIFGEGQEGAQ